MINIKNNIIFKLTLRKIVKFNNYDVFYKILKQKKQKWKFYILLTENQFKLYKYKKFKLIDQYKIKINTFSNKQNSYKKNFKENFLFYKKLNYYYSGSKNLRFLMKKNIQIVKFFENRLDFILFKLKFCLSIKSACNYIKNKNVFVNKQKLKLKTYFIHSGDFIKLKINSNIYQYNLVKSNKWSLIIQNYTINYKTKEFIFLGNINNNYLSCFPTYLKLLG